MAVTGHSRIPLSRGTGRGHLSDGRRHSQLTGRAVLARRAKLGAATAIGLGAIGLVHDLGRLERFANMLRVMKPSSPMSVGSWLLAGYGPMAAVVAASEPTGRGPAVGMAATGSAPPSSARRSPPTPVRC